MLNEKESERGSRGVQVGKETELMKNEGSGDRKQGAIFLSQFAK